MFFFLMNINIMCFPTNQIKIILIRRYWSNSYGLKRVYYSAAYIFIYAINKNNHQVVVSDMIKCRSLRIYIHLCKVQIFQN